MKILSTSDYQTVRELCDALKESSEPTSLLVGDQVVIVTPAEKATEQIDLAAMRAEVASVLELMDGIEIGDERLSAEDVSVFRQCRDRLRALIN